MSDSNNKDIEGLGKVLDHDYDQIRELDNPLPGWWLTTFWLTIVFSVGYYAYYQFLGGPTLDEELKQKMTQAQVSQTTETAKGDGATVDSEASLKALVADSTAIEKGKAQFNSKCAACHLPTGGGSIGPNLTDDYWIHGDGSLLTIQQVVKKGVLDKGMPAWEALMSPDDLRSVVVYIHTLHGTNPAGAKAAQGEKHEFVP